MGLFNSNLETEAEITHVKTEYLWKNSGFKEGLLSFTWLFGGGSYMRENGTGRPMCPLANISLIFGPAPWIKGYVLF